MLKNIISLTLTILVLSFVPTTTTQAAGKYNVLLVMSDDLNNDLHCYGDPLVQSPNLDRLAERGMRFDRAYCQYPLCNPSRASMMTGLLPDKTEVLRNSTHFRTTIPKTTTLPQLFKNNGYFTARIGKIYHYGVPREIGTSGIMDDPPSWDQVINPRGRDKEDEKIIKTLRAGQYGGTLSWLAAEGTDDEQTDGIGAIEAVDLLDARHDKPFFLAVGFYRPHTPYVAPKVYFNLYPRENLQLATLQPNLDQLHPASLMSHKTEHDDLTDPLRREVIQAYYASTTFMDAQLGKLLDAMDRHNLWENTIVVFASDHGYHLGEHGLWQKMSLFEESARVPLVIYHPEMKAGGKSSNSPVELMDVYPTLAELCGLDAPNKLNGESLLTILEDPSSTVKAGALTQVSRKKGRAKDAPLFKGYSIRTDRYRYTEWDEGREGVELYDHKNDPEEFNNLAESDDAAKTLGEMKELLRASIDRANR